MAPPLRFGSLCYAMQSVNLDEQPVTLRACNDAGDEFNLIGFGYVPLCQKTQLRDYQA